MSARFYSENEINPVLDVFIVYRVMESEMCVFSCLQCVCVCVEREVENERYNGINVFGLIFECL